MRLFGRDRELADVVDRLDSSRLVSLVGPGGVGKTALARAVIDTVPGARYPHGVHFVDFTSVDDPDEVAAVLAAQLGFPTFEALVTSPTEVPALVVADNCEHLIDQAADAVLRLLEACRSPTVLATSRAPLDIPGEQVVLLGPLPAPAAGLADLTQPAVQLFFARAADSGASLGPSDLPAVVELCQALDGLPLALELAAARTRSLTPAEILSTLDVTSLSRPRFRGAERHRSLRSTIQWSYQLLSAEDRELFDRLGAISGEFDLDTAAAVTGRSAGAVLDGVEGLVSASLLVPVRHEHATTYRQLHIVRVFAREHLRATEAWGDASERLVAHVLERAQGLSIVSGGRWESRGSAALARLHDEVLAALRWCLEHDASPERAFALQGLLWESLHLGSLEQASALSERVLARWPSPSAYGWADAAATAAVCRFLGGRVDDARVLAEQALGATACTPRAPCVTHRLLGQLAAERGEHEVALRHFEAAATAGEAGGVARFGEEMRLFAALVRAAAGRPDQALDDVLAVRETSSAAGADLTAVWAGTIEAHLLLMTGGDAISVAERAVADSWETDTPACHVVNLHTLATAAVTRGDLPAAAELTTEALEVALSRGVLSETRPVLRLASALLQRAGVAAWAELAATVVAMPSVSILDVPGLEVLSVPAAHAQPLSRRDAFLLARAALRGLAAEAPAPVQASEPAADAAMLRRGDFWEIRYAGRAVTVKAAKGIADLARLVERPGKEVHCGELAGVVAEQRSTGELVDGQARRAYEGRLRALQVEIDEATADNDLARAESARAEFDAIVDHLSSAIGLRGGRRTGETAERARTAVTQRLRGTIRRLGSLHPELGRHLQASVSTGLFCCYRPELPVRWTVADATKAGTSGTSTRSVPATSAPARHS